MLMISRMTLTFFITWLLFMNGNSILAQSTRSFRVKSGDDAAQAYSPQGFYRYPQFEKAVLYYKTGSRYEGSKFNYNLLSGTLQFIDAKGDTLDMIGTDKIDSVLFSNSALYNHDGWMERVAMADSVQLLKKIVMKVQLESIGAYDRPAATSAITSYKTYYNSNSVFNLVVNQDIVIAEQVHWLLTDKNNSPVKANKNNFLKMLSPAKQAKAEAWIKQNKTKFDREEDLIRLMNALKE